MPAALRDFGNLSASSTYYVFAYLESITGIKKGDKVLQVRRSQAWRGACQHTSHLCAPLPSTCCTGHLAVPAGIWHAGAPSIGRQAAPDLV
jgi:hypothetical protein